MRVRQSVLVANVNICRISCEHLATGEGWLRQPKIFTRAYGQG